METISLVMSYCGPAPLPADALWHWNLDPALWGGLAVLGAAIAAGGRAELVTVASRPALVCAFAALLVAFVSPLCALASALFSARVLHHIVLVSAAAPLVAYGLAWRRAGSAWGAAFALLHALVFWSWHAPAAYEAALSSDLTYWIMQVSIFGSAVLLWAAILGSPPLAGIGLALASMIQMGLLGALLAFARQAVYTPHFGATAAWGLTPLADQQLAGVLMWVLGGLSFFAAALWHGLRLVDPRPQPAC